MDRKNIKKVLVADDESGITRLISSYLKREGFITIIATNGIEAYDLYIEKKPDLLILDIMMPELSGLELAELIRKDSSVPIIMLTAKTDERDRIEGFKYGIDDYVSKPFSPGELVQRVKAVLRRSTSNLLSKYDIIEYGPFVVNYGERLLLINGNLVQVTKAQFNILSKFISSPGQVFSREQLHSILNLQEPIDSSRTIDVQINNIRKLISRFITDPQVIMTHRGLGYSLKKGL